MKMTGPTLDELMEEVNKKVDDAVLTWNGSYSQIYRELRNLSPEEIADITPDITDQQEYERLIAIVQEASKRNMSQAALAERVRSLSETAKKIVKMVPSLAMLL